MPSNRDNLKCLRGGEELNILFFYQLKIENGKFTLV